MNVMRILEGYIDKYAVWIVLVFIILLLINLIVTIRVSKKTNLLMQKYKRFFEISVNKPDEDDFISLGELVEDYLKQVKGIYSDYDKIVKKLDSLEKNLAFTIQKVGIIRYNPFDEVGGNLCFAIALLDAKDSGIVLNGIYSRSGSYTYAKEIIKGESAVVLSAEEMQAIADAKRNAYLQS